MAMGHSDLRTTMGYYKFLPEHVQLLAQDIRRTEIPDAMRERPARTG